MKTTIILITCIFLTGCAIVHTLPPAGNHQRYEVECTGKLVSMNVCYEKAASLCPKGFKILNKNVAKHNPFFLETAISVGTELSNQVPGVVKGINIECK